MSQTYQDPVAYLNEAITTRGKSTHNGVYLTNITVVADSRVDYGYKEFPPRPDPCGIGQLGNHFEEVDWLNLLVTLRGQKAEMPVEINRGKVICQFVPEGPHMSLNSFMPKVYCEGFSWEVSFHQELLKWVCDFVGKLPTHVRFNIGYANRSWQDLLRTEEVQEMDLNY